MSGLVVRDLGVGIMGRETVLKPVDGVSFEVEGGQCVVLLGESGCGKSLTALALMRLLPEGAAIAAGSVSLDGEELLDLPEREMRQRRGRRLAMIFQEPQTSLNPVLSIGRQIGESLAEHRGLAAAEAVAEAARLIEAVGLPRDRLATYPFQLSGGQRQRALIAMMLAGDPKLLIADEPTTALDVTVQAQILRLLGNLQRERGMGLLLITHDLDVARDMADRVAVMYAGQIVEWTSREHLFAAALHPYTRRLFQVLPSVQRRGEALAQIPGMVPAPDAGLIGCRFAERCPLAVARCREEAQTLLAIAPGHWVRCWQAAPGSFFPDTVDAIRGRPVTRTEDKGAEAGANPLLPRPLLELTDLKVHFPIRKGLWQRVTGYVKAVDGVSLRLDPGETLALVGESGCGKTTLARAALRLLPATAGRIILAGEDITTLGGEAMRRKRALMQIVFQDPFSSLNPRMRVGDILTEGMLALRPDFTGPARAAAIAALLERVGLPAAAVGRYPHEFSGGQRQRIAIARALAVEPRVLICDEPTSALDVSVQAQILNLLLELQRERGLAYLFITHNLPVVGYLAHRVAVMYRGRLVEEGEAAALLSAPRHDYTRMLLDSAPGRGLSR